MIAAAKPLNMRTAVMAPRRTVAIKARRTVVVRAESEAKPTADVPQTNEDGTVFYAGNTFASEEAVRQLFIFKAFQFTSHPTILGVFTNDCSIHCYQHLLLVVTSKF
jgi:hypothetical protein